MVVLQEKTEMNPSLRAQPRFSVKEQTVNFALLPLKLNKVKTEQRHKRKKIDFGRSVT